MGAHELKNAPGNLARLVRPIRQFPNLGAGADSAPLDHRRPLMSAGPPGLENLRRLRDLDLNVEPSMEEIDYGVVAGV